MQTSLGKPLFVLDEAMPFYATWHAVTASVSKHVPGGDRYAPTSAKKTKAGPSSGPCGPGATSSMELEVQASYKKFTSQVPVTGDTPEVDSGPSLMDMGFTLIKIQLPASDADRLFLPLDEGRFALRSPTSFSHACGRPLDAFNVSLGEMIQHVLTPETPVMVWQSLEVLQTEAGNELRRRTRAVAQSTLAQLAAQTAELESQRAAATVTLARCASLQ